MHQPDTHALIQSQTATKPFRRVRTLQPLIRACALLRLKSAHGDNLRPPHRK